MALATLYVLNAYVREQFEMKKAAKELFGRAKRGGEHKAAIQYREAIKGATERMATVSLMQGRLLQLGKTLKLTYEV